MPTQKLTSDSISPDSPLDKFWEVRDQVLILKQQQAGQGELHQPSAIEKWLDYDSPLFYDEGCLSRFRDPRQPLGGGSINWPGFWRRHFRWEYVDGAIKEKPVGSLTRMLAPVGDSIDLIRGRIKLVQTERELRPYLPDNMLETLGDSDTGHPMGVKRGQGRFITEPFLRHIYYVGQVLKHLPGAFLENAVVLEVGAGYGGLARLLKIVNPGLRYILVDLPERLSLQAYYLTQAFPEMQFQVVHGETSFSEGFAPADFWFCPTWKVSDVPEHSVNLVINTHSFQEMTLEQIEFYLHHVDRVCRGYFYCVNRFEKQIGDELVRHPGYLLSDHWETVYQQPQPTLTRILEALYRRAVNDN